MKLNFEKTLPPGLREFAAHHGFSEEITRELAQTWDTIRGRRPQTAAEWARFWELLVSLEQEDDDE